MKKATLGRGLDALIPIDEDNGFIIAGIDQLKHNSFQPRKDFDDDAIDELASSIREKGIIQPLVVRKSGNYYEIIAGERRWRAAQKAGLTKVPIILKDVSDSEVLELALIENLQREDLNPIEEAIAYDQLIADFGLTHGDISKRIGKERSTITNQVRLLKLPAQVKQALKNGEITAGHARAILSIDSQTKAIEILEIIQRNKLSVRQTEKIIRNLTKKQGENKKPSDIDLYLKHLTEELKRSLGTQIKIIDKNGSGKIEIEYYSKDELERLIEMLTTEK
ncbi:ParB/RepB/Spo0J family partition protein [Desulfobacterota bacterium AH_259_B03_O07]|nr:ParB/RepB/Spo0J family partition protein [Desulfobacterota bacterium AH_259_B03_O07]